MSEHKSKKKKYSAPALTKGLDIIELLAGEVGGLSLSEISERLGRSTSEIFRMLFVLQDRNYVAPLPNSDKFNLTLKLFSLSFRQPRLKRLTGAAAPIMLDLSHKIFQSCHLVVQYNGRGVVIAQQDSPSVSGFSVRLGAEVPIIGTCSGNILLSYASDEERKEALSRQPKHLRRPSETENLEAVRERVLKRGYEHIQSSLTKGVEDIGFPILDYTGATVAALVVPFLPHLDTPHELTSKSAIPFVREAAGALSMALGHND